MREEIDRAQGRCARGSWSQREGDRPEAWAAPLWGEGGDGFASPGERADQDNSEIGGPASAAS